MSRTGTRFTRLDVLMPTYNSAKHLEKVLDSLDKTIPNHRLIAVDRHSNDGTPEVLRTHGAKVYFEDVSLGHARQLLLEKSSSPVLLMLDSDVVIEDRDGYEEGMQLLGTRSEDGRRIGAVALIPRVNPPMELEKYKRFWWRILPSLERDFFVTHSTLFLRESVEGIHIPDRLGAAEDVYIWLHLRNRGYVSRTIPIYATHYFTLSERKGRWMGANLRILQTFVGMGALTFVLSNVVLYPLLALLASIFTLDLGLLRYNIKRWIDYLTGYLMPTRYSQMYRG